MFKKRYFLRFLHLILLNGYLFFIFRWWWRRCSVFVIRNTTTVPQRRTNSTWPFCICNFTHNLFYFVLYIIVTFKICCSFLVSIFYIAFLWCYIHVITKETNFFCFCLQIEVLISNFICCKCRIINIEEQPFKTSIDVMEKFTLLIQCPYIF